MRPRLRRADLEDLGAVVNLVACANATYGEWAGGSWTPPAPEDEREAWRSHPADPAAWSAIVEEEDEPLGCVSFMQAGSLAHLSRLFVSPLRWRERIGTELLSAATEEMRRRGLLEAELFVPARNLGARRFYERGGWRPRAENGHWQGLKLVRYALELMPDDPAEEPIRLVPYDPAWPRQFAEERAALAEAIGVWASGGIHHVGSTAVPGLAAKPVIDILVGVESLEASRACFERLARLEYLYAPYRAEEMHWFCKPHPSRRTHHLHLVPTAAQRFRDELAFRDRLRSSLQTAGEYAILKHGLAQRFAEDREAYTDAKGDFIARVLGR